MGWVHDRLIMGDDRGYRFLKVNGFFRNGYISLAGMFHIVKAKTDDFTRPEKRKKGKILKAMPAFLTILFLVVKLRKESDIKTLLSEKRREV
jgi:hypothetical protein